MLKCQITNLLALREAENNLTNCLVRIDNVFQLIAAIEKKLIEKKEILNNTDTIENTLNFTEQIKWNLLKLVIKEFDCKVVLNF